MSFEDGAVLAAHVLEKGLSAATLRDFERERIPRVATIVRQEEVSLLGCRLDVGASSIRSLIWQASPGSRDDRQACR